MPKANNCPHVQDIVYIPRNVIPVVNKWLRTRQVIDDEDTVLVVYTTVLGEHKDVDIKICAAREGGAYIEAVLFDHSKAVQTLDWRYKLMGDYKFNYQGRTYIVTVRKEPNERKKNTKRRR